MAQGMERCAEDGLGEAGDRQGDHDASHERTLQAQPHDGSIDILGQEIKGESAGGD